MPKSYSVRDHYERAIPVFEALGRVPSGYAPGNTDKNNWYVSDSADGADGRARPRLLARDIDADTPTRTVYAAVNYAPADYYMNAWNTYRWEDGTRKWDGGANPMPEYADLTAIAPFADVDLIEDVKAERAGGDIPTETVEHALDGYVAGFAELCGGRGPVHVLDSVGGAYVMVSPTVSAPIAQRFTGDDRAAVIQELTDRVNDHLKDVRDRVAEQVAEHDSVLDPDMVNHKNRIYKAPLSLHADIDGVVTPVDATEPRYDLTTPGDVTETLVEETTAWAESFTDDYTDRVGELVAALWGGDPGEWERTLSGWLRANATPNEPCDPRGSGGEGTPSAGGDGRTAPMSDVYRALDRLDAQEVAEQTIVHAWNDDVTTSSGVRAFYPTWGPNSNGRANIVSETVWTDTGAGDKGTVIEMALLGADGVSWTRGEIADGVDWVRGIKELRRLGYDVPLPEGDAPDDMSDYYAHDLTGVADERGVNGDPYTDDVALLKACLLAREETPALADEKPPYGALRAVADVVGVDMDDPEEGILGKQAYKVAKRVFDDMEPGEV